MLVERLVVIGIGSMKQKLIRLGEIAFAVGVVIIFVVIIVTANRMVR